MNFSNFVINLLTLIFFLLQHLVVTFDGASGLMKSLTNVDKNITLDVKQTLLYYVSHPVVKKCVTSDAYIFRSANTTAFSLSATVQTSVVQVEILLRCFFLIEL